MQPVSAQAVTQKPLGAQTREKKQSEKRNAMCIYLPELGRDNRLLDKLSKNSKWNH